MKRNLLIAAVLAGLTATSFGQGVVQLGAGGGKIKYTTDGSTLISAPTGNPDNVAGYGAVHVAIYSASNGTTLQLSSLTTVLGTVPNFAVGGWYEQTSTLFGNFSPSAGGFATSPATLASQAGAANATEQLEVVGWTGAFADFESAVAAGTSLVGWEGSLLISGGSGFTFSFGTGDGVTTSPIIANSTSTFNGLVLAPVPEPTTMLLGGLGAAALLLFRRRK